MRLEDEIRQDRFSNQYHKAVVNIIYTNNWIAGQQTKILRPYGITMQQYNVLRILRGQHPNPATIKLIKERMLDKMSDASRIVEKLRAKGLVERTPCISDRRNVDVMITPKGLELLAKIDIPEHTLENRLKKLSQEEIEQLNSLLDKARG
ncbi:MAG: MarR family transcriptional regulator [Ignavibacteria bacterium]|nr:MarR family transcriptional regulator [Ignavibacteria bacterium]MCU7503532.1 MarR family transcriptional regulator [Ignavibacteria bacterium]MCU7517278.1 MarR family transcriptional regulator [Ignavibacteria bacterium]